MKFILFVSVVFIYFTLLIHAAKILAIFPVGSYSHYICGYKVMKEMAKRGHEITFVAPYPLDRPIEKWKHVQVENFFKDKENNVCDFMKQKPSAVVEETRQSYLVVQLIKTLYQNKEFLKVLRSNDYDLVVFDNFTPFIHIALGYYFHCPVVILSVVSSSILTNFLFANPNPSFISKIGSKISTDMTFWDRIKNSFLNLMSLLINHIYMIPQLNNIIQDELGPMPPLKDLIYNVSMMLVLSHPSYSNSVPHVPAIKEIGGLNIDSPKKLPNDLQTYLDSATEGVILFSIGSFVKSSILFSDNDVKMLLKVFKNLPQKVLWKYEKEINNLPENVKLLRWLPQQDILAHRNIKVFISHCGLLSVSEATYFGVPLVCLPIYWDQFENAYLATKKGFAINIPFAEISERNLETALNKIINDKTFRENVIERSIMLRDEPMKPLDKAIYWIEYVIRYNGAPHLRSPGMDLNWWQRNYLDIIGILLIILIAFIYLVAKTCLYICSNRKGKYSPVYPHQKIL